ncbi:hypothetical protein LXL04_010485 [Taraxacum kok-saghyz]
MGVNSVVPFHVTPPAKHFPPPSDNRYEIDFTRSNINSYNKSNYLSKSLSHSVSSSSIDVGNQQAIQLSGIDRHTPKHGSVAKASSQRGRIPQNPSPCMIVAQLGHIEADRQQKPYLNIW